MDDLGGVMGRLIGVCGDDGKVKDDDQGMC